MTGKQNQIRILFYSLWLIGLAVQAFCTELTGDEAYYWMYSQDLAWGYFDHPPLLALMIKAGYSLFQNAFGVRLFSILASLLTIYTWELILKPKDLKIFYFLVLSIAIVHYIGFIATVDSPFLLMASCFFLVYQNFIRQPGWKISLLLAFTTALMLLAKYHGLVVIGLVILSNPKILKSRYFWLTVIVSTLLLIPHFLWQVSADFATLKYHFFERSILPYKFSYTLEYLFSQLFVLGPFTGIIFIISAIYFKAINPFEKSLKMTFWGGYVFFFIMSFKGRVEAHWTLFVLIPAIYIAYHYILKSPKTRKIVLALFPLTLLLIFVARIFIILDIIPKNKVTEKIVTQYHGNDEWAHAIKEEANGLPIAFMNSYQKASLYSFYSKSNGFSLNNVMSRKNQFDIWNVEDVYRGEKIMVIPNYEIKELDSIPGLSKTTRYTFIENFQSFSKIKVDLADYIQRAAVSDTLTVKIRLENTGEPDINFSANKDYPSCLNYQFFDGKNLIKETEAFKLSNEMLDQNLDLKISMPDRAGKYGFYISIKTGWLPPTINSKRFEIIVEEKTQFTDKN